MQLAEPGSYAQGGVRRLCPAGSFGDAYGLEQPETLAVARCSGLCAAAHWCAEGSTSATQRPCPAGRSVLLDPPYHG